MSGLVKTALHGIASTGLNPGDVINVGFGYMDYKNAKQQGNSTPVSLGKAAASFAWGEFFYGGLSSTIAKGLGKLHIKNGIVTGGLSFVGTAAVGAAMAAPQLLYAMGRHTTQEMSKAYGSKGKFGSGYFEMSQAGYTMRQRSLNAIRSNGLNTQSALGNEARTYYRGSV